MCHTKYSYDRFKQVKNDIDFKKGANRPSLLGFGNTRSDLKLCSWVRKGQMLGPNVIFIAVDDWQVC